MRLKVRALRWLLVPLVLALGALVARQMIRSAPPTPRRTAQERAQAVRVMPAPLAKVRPRARGYGTVEPARAWTAVAQVEAAVIRVHPQLVSGGFVKHKDELIALDDREYALRVAQEEASLRATDLELAELSTEEENARASLAIERETLAVAERLLGKATELLASGSGTESDVDQNRQQVLQARSRVQNVENSLSSLEAKRKVLAAKKQLSEAQRDVLKLQVERCVITAPYDLRILEADLDVGQVVTRGTVLARGDGMKVAEVPVRLPVARMRPLVPQIHEVMLQEESEVFAATRRALTARAFFEVDRGRTARWDARIDRIAGFDVATRTLTVVAAIDDPWTKVIPGKRPPVARGIPLLVEVFSPARGERVVVPRTAVHEGRVWVCGPDDRLEIRPVAIAYEQPGFHVLEPFLDKDGKRSGLRPGEGVILSDLVLPLERMLLAPTTDAGAARALTELAEAADFGEGR